MNMCEELYRFLSILSQAQKNNFLQSKNIIYAGNEPHLWPNAANRIALTLVLQIICIIHGHVPYTSNIQYIFSLIKHIVTKYNTSCCTVNLTFILLEWGSVHRKLASINRTCQQRKYRRLLIACTIQTVNIRSFNTHLMTINSKDNSYVRVCLGI